MTIYIITSDGTTLERDSKKEVAKITKKLDKAKIIYTIKEIGGKK